MVYFLGYRLKIEPNQRGVDFFKIFFYRHQEHAHESLSYKMLRFLLKNKRATGLAHFFGFSHSLQVCGTELGLRPNLSYF